MKLCTTVLLKVLLALSLGAVVSQSYADGGLRFLEKNQESKQILKCSDPIKMAK